MKKLLKQVADFMQMSRQEVNDTFITGTIETGCLRYELMKEENEEYLEALKDKNLVEIADALGDQLYILLGTINYHGAQHIIKEVFEKIHENNMLKCPEGICAFRKDGKLIKPNGHPRVDLRGLAQRGVQGIETQSENCTSCSGTCKAELFCETHKKQGCDTCWPFDKPCLL